jgi:hypothetical protein
MKCVEMKIVTLSRRDRGPDLPERVALPIDSKWVIENEEVGTMDERHRER